ncbi:MAG: DNA glycosylase [Candidatus Micrarchaeia archaeon]
MSIRSRILNKGTIIVELFDLNVTLSSGQVFGWKRMNEWWIGEIYGNLVKLRQKSNRLEFELLYGKDRDIKKKIKKYFTLDIPSKKIKDIYVELSKDRILKNAIKEFKGLRIIRQEPWYCTATFVCSSFSNIPRIEKIVEKIKETHGTEINKEQRLYLFPSIKDIRKSDLYKLRKCGLGFRDKYLHQIAKRTSEKWFKEIEKEEYKTGKEKLTKLPGIGEKIADCILLFGYGKGEAFPIDVWIGRIMIKLYGTEIRKYLEKNGRKTDKITDKDIREFAIHKWNGNAGLAQQFLYMYARKHKIR